VDNSLINILMEPVIKIEPIEQHVIDVIRKLRRSKKMRQEDLANIINTSTSFVGNVENVRNPAKYNLKHINAISDYFGLSPKYFLPDSSLQGIKEKTTRVI